MALFLSTYVNKIDKKGRLSVPAPFRNLIAGPQSLVGMQAPNDPAIECFPYERLEKIASKIDELPLYSDEHQDLTASFFANVCQFSLDPEGRITLSQSFIEYADLKGEVAVVGRGHIFQIWNHEAFLAYSQEAHARTRKDLKTLRLVLGGGSSHG